ncbi:MAG: hypothetical protein PVI57_05515 [Gemmatimonadota bacterium]
MAADTPGRELRAFAVAPLAALGLWEVATVVRLAVADGLSAAVADLPVLVVGGATYGLVVAVAATVLLGGPAYALAVVLDRVSALAALLGGAVAGIVLAWMLSRLGDVSSLLPWWVGGAVGAGTGGVWWLVAGPRPDARRP